MSMIDQYLVKDRTVQVRTVNKLIFNKGSLKLVQNCDLQHCNGAPSPFLLETFPNLNQLIFAFRETLRS